MTDCPVTKADLQIYQGDDYMASVKVMNDDGTDADLTGYTAQAQIRYGPADEEEEIIVDLAPVVAPEGLIAFTIPRAVTADLSGRYQWDLQIVAGTGEVTTLLAGDVVAVKEITR